MALVDKILEMPNEKTISKHMIVDDKGYLWIETHEKDVRNGLTHKAYDIFDESGYYVFKVWSVISPGLFKNGSMYQMIQDEETGYRTFKRYSVVWSNQ